MKTSSSYSQTTTLPSLSMLCCFAFTTASSAFAIVFSFDRVFISTHAISSSSQLPSGTFTTATPSGETPTLPSECNFNNPTSKTAFTHSSCEKDSSVGASFFVPCSIASVVVLPRPNHDSMHLSNKSLNISSCVPVLKSIVSCDRLSWCCAIFVPAEYAIPPIVPVTIMPFSANQSIHLCSIV